MQDATWCPRRVCVASACVLPQPRQHILAMRVDESYLGASRQRAPGKQAVHRSKIVNDEFHVAIYLPQIDTATSCPTVHEDDRLASVELIEDRCELRQSRRHCVVARHDSNSVGFQRVQCILDLAQAAVDIRERKGSKESETSRMVPAHAGSVFIHFAGNSPSVSHIAEPRTRHI